MEPDFGEPTSPDVARFQGLREQSRALVVASEQARARARATREQIWRGRERREVLHDSAFARLMAKQETMPVIEQAKGIVMAQRRCGPEEAFDVLRQVSQRTNVKVHVLAARIVQQIAASNDGCYVIPISLGTQRYQRPRSGHGHHPGDSDYTLSSSAQAPRSLREDGGSMAGEAGSPLATPAGRD